MNERYDETNKTLWVACDLGPDDLVPEDDIQGWIEALKEGRAPDGREIQRINYVFDDRESAEYNHHALKFARIGTWVGSLDENEPFDEDAVSFATEDDFGV